MLMFTLAGLGSLAHAAGFDERLQAPRMKDAVEFKSQAQSLAARYREIQAAAPAQLVTNASLTSQQFDLKWQVEHEINMGRPPTNLEEMGFENLGNGSYRIDTRQHPEWRDVGERMAAIFNSSFREGVLEELAQRGFRPEDVAALRQYVTTHDFKRATRAATDPVARGFQKLVQKFDKLGRPVPDSTVISYWYQSGRAYFEANRAWSNGLLKELDAQRNRVLLSYLTELETSTTLVPESVSEGISATLASVRSGDFERLMQTTEGDAP
ncbi:MAG TPA: hypothetical protein VFS13_11400 [Steroidobacteraceae bacterium]|nr:hypothetical protein [Steroidobacteraceae bacterium]